MLAAEATAEVHASSGWFLEHAWVIPIIPAVAFALIIFFGKKMPMKGSEFGVVFFCNRKAVRVRSGDEFFEAGGSVRSGAGAVRKRQIGFHGCHHQIPPRQNHAN